MRTRATSIFKVSNVAKALSPLNDKHVVDPVNNAPNNIVFVCNSY
jgi:hypothetical protein